jgi:hypothetical protein
MFVRPLGFGAYVNVEPLLRGALPGALELSIHVLLPTVAMQRQSDPREDLPIIVGTIIEILEQTSIRRNLEPPFTQYAKAAKRNDGVQVQVDQLTPEIVQNGNKKFAWRKTKPSHEIGFETDDDGFINHRKLQISGGRKHPTWKPADDVISSEIRLCYHQRFPVFIQHRDLLLCNRLRGSVGGGR